MAEELQLTVDPSSDVPLYRQIVDHVWVKVASGILEPGNRLPTVRQVAIDLGVHLDTVERAYRELELLGVVAQHPGEGCNCEIARPDREQGIEAEPVPERVQQGADVARELRLVVRRRARVETCATAEPRKNDAAITCSSVAERAPVAA